MSAIDTILNQYQLALGKDNVELQSSIVHWVKSGAAGGSERLLNALATESRTVYRFQRRLHAANPQVSTEVKAKQQLLDALALQARGLHAFATGVAANQPAVRVAALRQSESLLHSAAKSAWSARAAARCGKTC